MGLFSRKERARQRPIGTIALTKKPSIKYYSPAPASQANTPKQKSKQFWGVKVLKKTAGLVLFAVVASSMYLNPNSLSISIAKPSEPALSLGRDQGVYLAEAKRLLNEAFISKTKITINTQKVESELMRTYPELESAKVIVPLIGASPRAALKLKQVSLIFSNGSQFYAVDNSGKAIISSLEFPDVIQINAPIVTDQSRPEISLKKNVLSSGDVEFIKTLADQLKNNNLSVIGYTLPIQPNELHVKINGAPYYIKFNLKTDARIAAGVFIAVKSKLEADSITPSEYIDVRVEERAFYK